MPTRFRRVFDSVQGLLVLLEVDSERFEIVAVSGGCARAFRRHRDELVGHPFCELFPDEPGEPQALGRAEIRLSLERVVREREIDVIAARRFAFGRADAEARWYRHSSSPVLGDDGAILYVLHELEDVTEFVREAEQVRHRYEQARQEERRKSEYFASVSHELRTPLTLVLGHAQQLISSPDVGEAPRRQISIIARNARALRRTVDDLLDAAKLEVGGLKPDYAELDLAFLVRLVTGQFSVLAHEKGVTLAVEAPESLPCQADSEKIERVILNLLTNAFKFNPGRGRIGVDLRSEDGRAVLEVSDSGPGIPPDKREEIFERFRQLDQGPARRFGGTGIGLSIARDLVALHGGTIEVGDAPGGGALFRVTLPVAAPPGASLHAAPEGHLHALAAFAKGRAVEELQRLEPADTRELGPDGAPLVLVIEDDPAMARFLAEGLADRYRVARAYDGESGLELALRLRPDLVIVDILMPGTSGDALVRSLRAREDFAPTPILIVTAKVDERLLIEMLESDVQGFVTKPFDIVELRARAANLIGKKRAEEAVREARATLDGILDVSTDAVVGLDEEQRITRFNRSAELTFGWARAEVLGRPLEVLIPERFREVHRRRVADFARGPSTARLVTDGRPDVRGLRRDGSEFPAEVSISKIEIRGHAVLTVALHDVSERRRILDDLRRAIDVRDEILGMVAHDLRSPLMGIRLGVERLRRSGSTAERQDLGAANAIDHAARRMERLIDDLLDSVKLEAGRLFLDKRRVAPVGILEEAVEEAQQTAVRAGLELALEIRGALPELVCDRERCLQVFDNLLTNAVKFTRAPGRIVVGAEAEGERVCFWVRDTGEGIAARDVPHLFERFWQKKADRRGVGLGLPIVKAIVEAHGGRIWVESVPGAGSTFWFTLPATPAPRPDARPGA